MITSKNTIILIPGAFVSNNIWEHWPSKLEAAGFNVLVPYWPHKDAPAEVLKTKHPDKELATLRLKQLINFYEDYTRVLGFKVIVVAEGLGGVIAQYLLNKELLAGCVLINSWTPHGYLPCTKEMLGLYLKAINPFRLNSTFYISQAIWNKIFFGTLPERHNYYTYKYAVPESRRLLWDIIAGTQINYAKPHTPLLFLATNNFVIPVFRQYSNYKAYTDASSIKKFKTFYDIQFPLTSEKLQTEIIEFLKTYFEN